jgi:hypothetical protein
MKGWIKIHREIQDHWLWNERREYSRAEAWIDILLTVNHAESKVMIKGHLYTVKRGESVNSLETWGKRWNWTRGRVKRFLELLKNDSMIEIKTDTKTTQLTVCNYDSYQDERNTDEHQTDIKQTSNRHQTNTNKNVKNNKKNKNNKIESIDSTKLMAFFNETFGKNHEVFPPKTQQKFRNLLKIGFTKAHIMRAMVTVSKNEWHIKNYNHQITIDYFADANNLNKWGNEEPQKQLKYNPHL